MYCLEIRLISLPQGLINIDGGGTDELIKGGRSVATLLDTFRTCSNAAQVKRAWATVSSCLQNGHGATRHFLSLENNVKTGSTPHLACEMVTLTTPG